MHVSPSRWLSSSPISVWLFPLCPRPDKQVYPYSELSERWRYLSCTCHVISLPGMTYLNMLSRSDVLGIFVLPHGKIIRPPIRHHSSLFQDDGYISASAFAPLSTSSLESFVGVDRIVCCGELLAPCFIIFRSPDSSSAIQSSERTVLMIFVKLRLSANRAKVLFCN